MLAGVSPALNLGFCLVTAPWDSPTSIFSTTSTPANTIHSLSLFVLAITGGIFVAISALLAYAVVRFRARPDDDTEPPQVFGSTQIELSWTIIPILIIVMLFLGTARVIFAVQDAPEPAAALNVLAIGHQFWWEFRYPKYGIITANELHVPLSDPKHPTPTYMKLTSADVIHSFWVPSLAGKTDMLPNRVNEMWLDPQKVGMYEGQCGQFCGPEHAKMLLRVYVDSPEQFQRWVANQQQNQESGTLATGSTAAIPNGGNGGGEAGVPANTPPQRGAIAQLHEVADVSAGSSNPDGASDAITPQQGRRIFEEQACINCHAVHGTVADGRYGPDLTHLMSRDTIAAGAAPMTYANLLSWITDPNDLKPGSLMPAMHLTDTENKQLAAYLMTLK